jgi:hypothetical protein
VDQFLDVLREHGVLFIVLGVVFTALNAAFAMLVRILKANRDKQVRILNARIHALEQDLLAQAEEVVLEGGDDEVKLDEPPAGKSKSPQMAKLADDEIDLTAIDSGVELDSKASGTKRGVAAEEEIEIAAIDEVAEGGSGVVIEDGEIDTAEEAPGAKDGQKTVKVGAAPVTSARRATKAVVTKRATVRYYSRMNPERVYPLLVILSREAVEKVRKQDTDQRTSGPFQVKTDAPVEVEPVLPGCDCYPPKATARLEGEGDLTLTFRVVPRALGRLDGATVFVRQDHACLAEVPLGIKVVKRTWVAVSGLATFALPGLSAVLKHFGLDFDSQREAGFNGYLALANLAFDRVSPLALTAGLGLFTGLLYFLTRPRARDVFWDVEKVGPGEKLARIAAVMAARPKQASDDLLDLLKAFPDYQPAHLFYAEWQYDVGAYQAALDGYLRAFYLGPAKASDYHKASLAASRLKQNRTALQILQGAESALPAGRMPGLMLYNMGCYHALLGEFDQAMACLRRALAAGYREPKSYRRDADLKPLRGRDDFKRLLASLAQQGG